MIVAASGGDLGVLFVLLALFAFGGAIYAALVLRNWVIAIVLAVVGFLILAAGW